MVNYNLEYAMKLINDFCTREYDSTCDFEDLTNVSLAYTTLECDDESGLALDEVVEIQVYVDLVNYELKQVVGDKVNTWSYDSLEDLIKNELEWLDFDSLVSIY